MLMCKIESVEVVEVKYFSQKLKVTSCNGAVDFLNIDVTTSGIIVEVEDRDISSYVFKDNKICDSVIKVKGALSGCLLELGCSGARLQSYKSKEVDTYCESRGMFEHFIHLGETVVQVSITGDITVKPIFSVVIK